MNRIFWFLVFASTLVIAGAGRANGADAVFSQDGNRIFFAAGKLKALNLGQPKDLEKVTTSSLFGGEEIIDLTRMANGHILCMSAHHVVSYNPQDQQYAKVIDAPANQEFQELALNEKDSILLITLTVERQNEFGDEPLQAFCLRPGDPVPLKIYSRRVGAIQDPIFDSHGVLYFSWHGDLWRGKLGVKAGDWPDQTATHLMANGQRVKLRAILSAIRIAPLGRLETTEFNTQGTGVRSLAFSGSKIYVQVQRINGSGWGSLFTVDRPNKSVDEKIDYWGGNYEDFIEVLSSVKVIDKIETTSFLCASSDGKKVFYHIGRDYWLIENNKKPRKLPLHEKLIR